MKLNYVEGCVPAKHTLLNVFHGTLNVTQKSTTETQ